MEQSVPHLWDCIQIRRQQQAVLVTSDCKLPVTTLNSRGLNWDKAHAHEHRVVAFFNGEYLEQKASTETERLMLWGDHPAPQDFDEEISEIIQSCVEQVPEPYRTLLILRYSHQYSYNEITLHMGYSSKSVAWNHVQRAVKMLKEIILIDPKIRETYAD